MWLLVCLSFPVSSGLGLPRPAVNYLPHGGDRRKTSFFLFVQHHDLLVIARHGIIGQFSSDFLIEK